MTNESLHPSPFEIAKQKIPVKWYELSENTYGYITKAAIAGILLSTCTPLITAGGSYPWYLHLAAGGLYAASELIDTISTARCFDATKNSSLLGIQHNYHENSPALLHVKNSRDLIYNPRSYIPVITGLAISAAIPGFGIALSGGKFIAAFSNFRVARRLKLATEIAQSQTYQSSTNS